MNITTVDTPHGLRITAGIEFHQQVLVSHLSLDNASDKTRQGIEKDLAEALKRNIENWLNRRQKQSASLQLLLDEWLLHHRISSSEEGTITSFVDWACTRS